MTKKLHICNGKTCKSDGSSKKIKNWAKKLKIRYKKTGCLGHCKTSFAVRFKGEIFSCESKHELEKIISFP
jgi:NADH:ubiquinone oxidoreductase subunit E